MLKLQRMFIIQPRVLSCLVLISVVLFLSYWWLPNSDACSAFEYKEFQDIRRQHMLLLHKMEALHDEIQVLESKRDRLSFTKKENILPMIYVITPTYARYTQKADLVRLSQTLMHVPKLHWIIVEDSERKTQLVEDILHESGITYTHLAAKTQQALARKSIDPRWKKHRGVDQRNTGLKWLRSQAKSQDGVVYFADDDNTYHISLFKEMRFTRTVSMWPVALVGGLLWEGPVCENGKVVEFYTSWEPKRKFPVDMAAFSINLGLILANNDVYINPEAKRGYLESDFLSRLGVTREDVEAKGDDCKKILVWHTQTSEPNLKQEKKLLAIGQGSDPSIEI